MHIAVLGSSQSWHVQDLLRAAEGNHEIVTMSYSELFSKIDLDSSAILSQHCDLTEFDAILLRSMPHGSLEQVIFCMNVLGELAQSGVRIVNSPRSMEIAIDKYLATARLQRAGLQVPRTITCQTAEQALSALEELGGEAVLKPLFGSEGRGISRVSLHTSVVQEFQALEQIGAIFYLQEFIPHEGYDIRLFVIGNRILGMRRVNATDWRTNISRGATAETVTVTSELEELAIHAAQAVSTEIAGVDILPGRNGKLFALEVNAVPGWRALAEITQQDVAKLVLDYLN